jgi:antirestriction protein ArdC
MRPSAGTRRARIAIGLAAVALVGCAPYLREAGDWTLEGTCGITTAPTVDAATAERLARQRLTEMAPFAEAEQVALAELSSPVLACRLRTAHHLRDWSYHAAAEDTWLMEFRHQDQLLALAAIDATTGQIRAITYGQWK